MQRSTLFLALLMVAAAGHSASYTYRGTLNDQGEPANGEFDLRLSVLDASGTQPMAEPLTLHGVSVSKGSFSAEVDFGKDFAHPEQLQLRVEVQAGDEGFVQVGQSVPLIATSGPAACWQVGGNSGVSSGFIGTNSPTDPTVFTLQSRGDPILYIRGTSGGVEQNGSLAQGSGAAAWNNSSAQGVQSFTAGQGFTGANAAYSVVFADGLAGAFTSTLPNQFMIRADGGMFLNTTTVNSANADLVIGARPIGGDEDSDLYWKSRSGKQGSMFLSDIDGSFSLSLNNLSGANYLTTTANGAKLTAGGAWTNGSSREFKQAFIRIDPGEILSKVIGLPITSWDYKNSSEGRHVGPMAEDFKAAFGLGADAQHIATVDADGIALAAIQGLNQKLEAENAQLKARLDALEARINQN